LFAVLADPLRLAIVEMLAGEQLCTCHLVERTGAKQTTVSHHLRLLREAGAVTTTEEGRFTWYRLSPRLPQTLAEHLTGLAAAAESSGPGPIACP
jgi:ArsR family transcriptional regulator